MSDGYLITGVPGFIGARLVRRLLPEGRRLFLLCERRMREQAEAFVRELKAGDQVVVAPGDITETDLGLEPEMRDRIRAEVSDVYHLAAVYDLAVPEELARRVNVVGTGKVLGFLRGFSAGAVRHHYISTCYVAGTRTGMIFENELDRGQEFKNHYESTKYAAEVLVERSKTDIDTRILRPAIVIGDSRTGETAKFDGPYPGFGAVMMGWMIVLPGSGRAPSNLVPVDFVVEALATLPKQPDTAGKTFHLADPDPLSAREIIELAAERLAAPRPRLSVPQGVFRALLKLPKLAELSGVSPESFEYINHHQVFDTTNCRAALAGTGVSCPPLRSYINQILRYYRDHAQLPWRLDHPA